MLLIVGASSRLGRAFSSSLDHRTPVISTSRQDSHSGTRVQYRLGDDHDALLRHGPRSAIIFAAKTSIEACAREPNETRRINVEGVEALANALTRIGCQVTIPSTSLVFGPFVKDRNPLSPVDPVTQYGYQKAELEQRLAENRGVQFVRMTKVLTEGSFLETWSRNLVLGEPIYPFMGARIAPISTRYAIEGLKLALRKPSPGSIVHLSSADDVSMIELAEYLCDKAHAPTRLVRPREVATDMHHGYVVGPYASLSSSMPSMIEQVSWNEMVDEALEEGSWLRNP